MEVSYHLFHFGRKSKVGRGVGKFTVIKIKLQIYPIFPELRLLAWGSLGGLTRSRAAYVIGLGYMFGFLWLVPR